MHSLRKRVALGVGANGFGQVVTLVVQLVSVPVYLRYWSASEYGEWILLSALPAYFAMADIGFVSAIANSMAMLKAHDRETSLAAAGGKTSAPRAVGARAEAVHKTCAATHTLANAEFQTGLAPCAVVLPLVGASGFVVISLCAQWFQLDGSAALALACLIAAALVSIFTGLLEGIFRAEGRYASGVYCIHGARLLEWAGAMAGLVAFRSIEAVAAGGLLARLLGSTVLALVVRHAFPSFTWGFEHASGHRVRANLSPGLSFLGIPLANAIQIQGLTMVVGLNFGPDYLAKFNVYRTLSRSLIQGVAVLNKSLWPEFSRLHARGQTESMKRLWIRGTVLGTAASVVGAVLLLCFGETIVRQWVGGHIPYDAMLMGVFVGVAVLTSLWQVAMVVLLSTNTHALFSKKYLAASVLSVALSYSLAGWWGVYSAMGGLILFELIVLAAGHHEARKLADPR